MSAGAGVSSRLVRWGTSTTLVYKTRHPLLGLRWRHAYTSQYVRQLSAVGGQRFKRWPPLAAAAPPSLQESCRQSVWRTMCEVPGGTVGDVDHLGPQTRHPLLGLRWRHAYTSQYVRQLSAVGGQGCKRCLLLPPQRLRVSRNPAGRACGVRCVRCQVARWGTSTTLVYKTAILSSASAGGTPIHRQHVRQLSAVGGQRFKRCLLLPPQRLRVSRNPASRACGVPMCEAPGGTVGDVDHLGPQDPPSSPRPPLAARLYTASMSASCRRSEASVSNAASSCRHSASESPGIPQAERVAYDV